MCLEIHDDRRYVRRFCDLIPGQLFTIGPSLFMKTDVYEDIELVYRARHDGDCTHDLMRVNAIELGAIGDDEFIPGGLQYITPRTVVTPVSGYLRIMN